MNLLSRKGTVICAPITPAGRAGVSIVRVSGPNAADKTRKLAPFLPAEPISHTVYFGRLRDQQGDIDEVLLTYFGEGSSFTGEETVEIATHGNPEITEIVLSRLLENGVVTALPGEFTFRAFFNGRIDLLQAESILTLIEANHEKSIRLSMRQLKGSLSKKLLMVEDHLTWILANIEASIDFSTEDIDVLELQEIQKRAKLVDSELESLAGNYKKLRPVIDGLRVLFLGQPNVGKSSLLNALLGKTKAIVTDIPGTTRDLIEGQLRLENGIVTIVDSAGLRDTTDQIEKIGVDTALSETKNVDLIVYLVDSRVGLDVSDTYNFEKIDRDKIVVGTKSDLTEITTPRPQLDFAVSSRTGEGLDLLRAEFEKRLGDGIDLNSEPVLRARQYELLSNSKLCLGRAVELLHQNASLEFVALELREGLLAVYELLGKKFDDQIMDRVFSEFCIGK